MPWACMDPEEEASATETESCPRWTSSLGPLVCKTLTNKEKRLITPSPVTYVPLWLVMGLVSRQGIWLCGRLHRRHQCPGGHSALLRCRLHFHHFPAPHAVGRRKRVHQGPEEWGRSGAQKETSEERESATADADGHGPPCGPLPQPHYSCSGKKFDPWSL